MGANPQGCRRQLRSGTASSRDSTKPYSDPTIGFRQSTQGYATCGGARSGIDSFSIRTSADSNGTLAASFRVIPERNG
ncbi:hypothetical protein HHA01_22460 [Halomonas halmophila]|uniref:Uncharacterized protein n=1 Tax=Halomonas halmophila TaxID=252 RepID=A0A4Y4EZK8_9GAMM|nr:hypothetical protein [Halomonas halmophila]GED23269.1 hypothetical protein HHA01_22460 [Halomonas halmophila]